MVGFDFNTDMCNELGGWQPSRTLISENFFNDVASFFVATFYFSYGLFSKNSTIWELLC